MYRLHYRFKAFNQSYGSSDLCVFVSLNNSEYAYPLFALSKFLGLQGAREVDSQTLIGSMLPNHVTMCGMILSGDTSPSAERQFNDLVKSRKHAKVFIMRVSNLLPFDDAEECLRLMMDAHGLRPSLHADYLFFAMYHLTPYLMKLPAHFAPSPLPQIRL